LAFKGQIPDELVKAILEGSCMAFVGAGLSMNAKRASQDRLPSWGKLLEEMLQHAINNRIPLSDVENDLKVAINDGKYLLVAQELSERLGSEMFRNFLREVFLDVGLKPSTTHINLVKIPFRAFLTTNYDTLIEGAHTINNEGRIPPILTQEDLDKIPNPLKLKDTFVFKIHGDINRPETIVLTSHDYQDSLFRRPAYRSFLETLFTTNTVLFVGFGLSDQDVEAMLDKMASIFSRNNDSHYALIEKGKLTQLEIKRLALDKRIRIVEYDNTDGRHSQVNSFLESLYKLTDIKSQTFNEYEEKILHTNKREYLDNKKNKKIFLSYSWNDKEKAIQIAEKLMANGVDVWLDEWSVKIGDSLVSRINEGVKNSSYMIILVSKNYLKSKWGNKELQSALIREAEQKKTFIIPVVIERIEFTKMPTMLSDRIFLDMTGDIDEAISKLVRIIR
jgi:hypothetical protein